MQEQSKRTIYKVFLVNQEVNEDSPEATGASGLKFLKPIRVVLMALPDKAAALTGTEMLR